MFFLLQLNFGPVIPTPPYSEGEFYTVLERNVSIQVRPEWVMNRILLLHPLLMDAEMLTLVVLELVVILVKWRGEYWRNINLSLSNTNNIITVCFQSRNPYNWSKLKIHLLTKIPSARCRPPCQPRPWWPWPTTPPTWPTWRQPTDRLSKIVIDVPRGILLTNISFTVATLSQHSEQIKEINSFIPNAVPSSFTEFFQIGLFLRGRRKTGDLSQSQQTCRPQVQDVHYCSLRRQVQEIVGKLEMNVSWFYKPKNFPGVFQLTGCLWGGKTGTYRLPQSTAPVWRPFENNDKTGERRAGLIFSSISFSSGGERAGRHVCLFNTQVGNDKNILWFLS